MSTLRDNYSTLAVPIIPSDSSLILVDSKYRKKKATEEEPTTFQCELTDNVKAKYLYYQQLVWNQPVYSHNLTNNCLVFQIQDPISAVPIIYTYAVFARPFYCYTSCDGNSPDAHYQAPSGTSYARQMEYALNNDLRAIYNLFSPSLPPTIRIDINPVLEVLYAGKPIYHVSAGGLGAYECTIYFRYSITTGFVMWAKDELKPTVNIPIRLCNCPYIEKGHYIHGFGHYDVNQKKFVVDEDKFTNFSYIYSDSPPLLLPDRFYYITSPELAKQRKSQSITNVADLDSFPLELAVLGLNSKNSLIYHANSIKTEASSISIPSNNSIRSFHIEMRDEKGDIVRCGNRLTDLINDGETYGDPNYDALEFINTGYGGTRASPHMMNYLLFGNFNDTRNGFNESWYTVTNLGAGPYTLKRTIINVGPTYYVRKDLWEAYFSVLPPASLLFNIEDDEFYSNRYKYSKFKMINEDVIHVISSVLGVS